LIKVIAHHHHIRTQKGMKYLVHRLKARSLLHGEINKSRIS